MLVSRRVPSSKPAIGWKKPIMDRKHVIIRCLCSTAREVYNTLYLEPVSVLYFWCLNPAKRRPFTSIQNSRVIKGFQVCFYVSSIRVIETRQEEASTSPLEASTTLQILLFDSTMFDRKKEAFPISSVKVKQVPVP